MADPLTIVGTTAAVLDLALFIGEVISTAWELHETASGSTEQNALLEDDTLVLGRLLDTLDASSAARQSLEEGRLTHVASHCRKLGQNILELLQKSKSKRKSRREAIRAALSTVWNKSALDDLRREQAFCMTQLNLHLQSIMRSETGERLEEVLEVTVSNSRELSSMKKLLEGVKNGWTLDSESLARIRDVLVPSEAKLEAANQEWILARLKFDGMETRFEQVSDAATRTFEWCVFDSQVPESHPNLKIAFRDWLERGNGIFHICGKPGSGKSTLMKFLVQHSESKQQLRKWAATRKLIITQFFFYKAGAPLEKTIAGLVRSVLHSILKKLPELMPIVLSEFWNPDKIMSGPFPTESKISYERALLALDDVVKNASANKDYCLCLFLDGLDELEDPTMKQFLFAQKLRQWVEYSPENLKICASSREERSFMDQFPSEQRLYLHLLTKHDITKMIERKLEMHPSWLIERSTIERRKLVKEIATRADGVFLWVELVLHQIYEGLDDHESFQELQNLLDHIPDELEEFFGRILSSISKPYRQEAWTLFAVLGKLSENSSIFLLHYTYIRDVLRNSNFGTEQAMRDATVEDIEKRVNDFKNRFHRLGRGLLEIDDSPKLDRQGSPSYYSSDSDSDESNSNTKCESGIDTSPWFYSLDSGSSKRVEVRVSEVDTNNTSPRLYHDSNWKSSQITGVGEHGVGTNNLVDVIFAERIRFSHRSIYDYLKASLLEVSSQSNMKNFCLRLDIKSIVLQCLIAQVKITPWDMAAWMKIDPIIDNSMTWMRYDKCEIKHLEQLGSLDDVLLWRQHGSMEVQRIDMTKFGYLSEGYEQWDAAFLSIFIYSCAYGFESYVKWYIEHRPDLTTDLRAGKYPLVQMVEDIHLVSTAHSDYYLTWRHLLENGFNMESSFDDLWWPDIYSPWEHLVWKLQSIDVFPRSSTTIFAVTKIFLENDADARVVYDFEPRLRKSGATEQVFRVRVGGKIVRFRGRSRLSRASPVFRLACDKQGSVTLRKIVESLRPHDYEAMLALIDRNLARYAEAGGSNTPQIELIEPADTQPSLSQEKGEHQQEQVETLQFWYRPWRYNGRLFGSINAWRVPFGSFTFGALVVVMLMRRWR